ncbi:hypothetical protein Ae201684P_000195 [Aphanomyces euteiches]|nr:hypothetical protein Ae201684P_000195 [Aphanomyces euteiches]KAH9141010.1 hypothetical protein AeRB84_014781 [Aphanomyces euteiches]
MHFLILLNIEILKDVCTALVSERSPRAFKGFMLERISLLDGNFTAVLGPAGANNSIANAVKNIVVAGLVLVGGSGISSRISSSSFSFAIRGTRLSRIGASSAADRQHRDDYW